MLQPSENEQSKCNISVESENAARVLENDQEQSSGSDKYPAPLTPQIKHESQQLDDADCLDQTHSSEKECGEQGDESKSIETTCDNADGTHQISESQMPEEIVAKEENASADVSMLEKNVSRLDTDCTIENPSKESGADPSYKSTRRKMKVDWTPELHKKFVEAVEQLGVDQAIPSRILQLMKAGGLTRHNVASHLQKYRIQKKHILPKDEDRRLLHPRDPNQMSYYPQKPIMAFPPYHYNSAMPGVYPMWGQPARINMEMWGVPSYPQWQASENWHWNKPPNQPQLDADAWGFPVTPQPVQGGYSPYLQANVSDNEYNGASDSSEFRPAEEIIDKIMKEVMSKPWLPLPLGLKLPSTENVLAELSRQGICNIPPPINGSKSH